jgi:hypothetical protein
MGQRQGISRRELATNVQPPERSAPEFITHPPNADRNRQPVLCESFFCVYVNRIIPARYGDDAKLVGLAWINKPINFVRVHGRLSLRLLRTERQWAESSVWVH